MNHANEAKARQTRQSRHVAIAVAVALLVAVAIVVVTGLNRGRTYPPPPALPGTADEAVPDASRRTASRSANPGGLGDVVWSDLRGMALPVSARFGPADTIDGRATQFSHDWFGALLAAVHISARAAASAEPSVFRSTIGEQVVGANADKLLANVEANYRQQHTQARHTPGEPLPNAPSTLAGYRFDAVSDSTVSLRLATTIPSPNKLGTAYIAIQLEVRWQRGDWRLVAPPDGLWSRRSTITASASGYTHFPPR